MSVYDVFDQSFSEYLSDGVHIVKFSRRSQERQKFISRSRTEEEKKSQGKARYEYRGLWRFMRTIDDILGAAARPLYPILFSLRSQPAFSTHYDDGAVQPFLGWKLTRQQISLREDDRPMWNRCVRRGLHNNNRERTSDWNNSGWNNSKSKTKVDPRTRAKVAVQIFWMGVDNLPNDATWCLAHRITAFEGWKLSWCFTTKSLCELWINDHSSLIHNHHLGVFKFLNYYKTTQTKICWQPMRLCEHLRDAAVANLDLNTRAVKGGHHGPYPIQTTSAT